VFSSDAHGSRLKGPNLQFSLSKNSWGVDHLPVAELNIVLCVALFIVFS
jgi:hypothetical protein